MHSLVFAFSAVPLKPRRWGRAPYWLSPAKLSKDCPLSVGKAPSIPSPTVATTLPPWFHAPAVASEDCTFAAAGEAPSGEMRLREAKNPQLARWSEDCLALSELLRRWGGWERVAGRWPRMNYKFQHPRPMCLSAWTLREPERY